MRQVTGLYQLPETAAAPDARLRHQAIRGSARSPAGNNQMAPGRAKYPPCRYVWLAVAGAFQTGAPELDDLRATLTGG